MSSKYVPKYRAGHLKIDKAPFMKQKGKFQQSLREVKNVSAVFFFQIMYHEFAPLDQRAGKSDAIIVWLLNGIQQQNLKFIKSRCVYTEEAKVLKLWWHVNLQSLL